MLNSSQTLTNLYSHPILQTYDKLGRDMDIQDVYSRSNVTTPTADHHPTSTTSQPRVYSHPTTHNSLTSLTSSPPLTSLLSLHSSLAECPSSVATFESWEESDLDYEVTATRKVAEMMKEMERVFEGGEGGVGELAEEAKEWIELRKELDAITSYKWPVVVEGWYASGLT